MLSRPSAPSTARIVAKKIDSAETRIVIPAPWSTITGPERTTKSKSAPDAIHAPPPTMATMTSQTTVNVTLNRRRAPRRAAATCSTIGAALAASDPNPTVIAIL